MKPHYIDFIDDNTEEVHVIDKYPIDSVPIKYNERIFLRSSATEFIREYGLSKVIKIGYYFYSRIENNQDKVTLFAANTGYMIPLYLQNQSVEEMINLQPAIDITYIDQALLGWVHYLYEYCLIVYDSEYFFELFYSFVFLLHNTQLIEYQMGKTIENENCNECILFSLLCGEVANVDSIKHHDLTVAEMKELGCVNSFRNSINKCVETQRIAECMFVHEVKNNEIWNEYINLINNRKNNERQTKSIIRKKVSPINKINDLKNYWTIINKENDTAYHLTEELNKRAATAPNCFFVESQNGDLIRLTRVDEMNLILPITFNNVLIAYHLFLLDTKEENLSLLYFLLDSFVISNLSEYKVNTENYLTKYSVDSEWEGCVLHIHDVICNYYDLHRHEINTCTFDQILHESNLSGLGFEDEINLLAYTQGIKNRRKNNQELISSKESLVEASNVLDDALHSGDFHLLEEMISNIRSGFSNVNYNELRQTEIAKRLVVCVNAIYILVYTLDIIIDSDNYTFSRFDDVIDAKKRLSRLEYHLVNSTYLAPDIDVYSFETLNEYRERNGINSIKIERMNRDLYDACMMQTIKNEFSVYHEMISVDSSETADLFEIKKRMKTRLSVYPDSEMKKEAEELLDQEDAFICKLLIEKNKDKNDFNDYKRQVCSFFCHSYEKLPADTISALATAELLYSKYANENFADANFDYSCISSLYYQSVESLYNNLIWAPYSEMLNHLTDLNGQRFYVLYSNRKKDLPQVFRGYLPVDYYKYYCKNGRIQSNLPIGNFVYFLEYVTSHAKEELPHLQSHFASVFGKDIYRKNSDEFKSYIYKIDRLYDLLKKAKERRNDASHGGSAISIRDCEYDRKIVLDKVDYMRNEIFGIIDLFLSLYEVKGT